MDGHEAMVWITEMGEISSDACLVLRVACLLLGLIKRAIIYALDRTGPPTPPLSVYHEFTTALPQSRMLATARLEEDSAEDEVDDEEEEEEHVRTPPRRLEEDGRESYAGSNNEETGIQTTSGRPTRTRRPNLKYTGPNWVQ
jgi:hypothetical protein